MSELQLLIIDQIKTYEYALNKLSGFGSKSKAKKYYEKMRKEALTDLLAVQLKEFNKC